ncbi:LPXTG cell wall anchor domain-containing protein [Lactobacillus sp. YT155]|uniref:LPXTG cell wall anchor domain-containing protein n=1 Tax=Lactobacillus sp. YT155 TaxID=3060955 RepID=UPI00265D8017|nr:LPXTG cell wall anchor domain-containing protein [Lactobacillus sp. YT155]MDO1605887.1 LPXTG cell wall anchor domain-containing protein [Lactobacillus sp. YT155]
MKIRTNKLFTLLILSFVTIIMAFGSITNVNAASSTIFNGEWPLGKTEDVKDGLQVGTYMSLNGENSFFSTRDTFMKAHSDLDVTSNPSSVDQIAHMKNTTGDDKDVTVDYSLPAQSSKATSTDKQLAVYNGSELKAPEGMTIKYSFNKSAYGDWDATKANQLTSIQVKGTLKAGSEFKITMPLKLQLENFDIEQAYFPASVLEITYDIEAGASGMGYLQVHLTKPIKSDYKTSSQHYLGVLKKNADGAYIKAPEKIQKLLPVQNSANEIYYDNFDVYDYFNGKMPNESNLYYGGRFYINLKNIQDSIRNDGYSTLVDLNDTSKLQEFYFSGYVTVNSTPKIENDALKPGQLHVSLREVVNTKDYTLPLNSKWDNTKDVTVYDHLEKTVAVNSKDVKITGKVDTSKAGQYKVKYTYLPDNVSNTQVVTVLPGPHTDKPSNNKPSKKVTVVTKKLPKTGEKDTSLMAISGLVLLSGLTAAYVLNRKRA